MKTNDNWRMLYNGKEYACGDIPISCLATLRNAGEVPDFYVGENQYAAAPNSQPMVAHRHLRGEKPVLKKLSRNASVSPKASFHSWRSCGICAKVG